MNANIEINKSLANNIFQLYRKLNMSGQRGSAQKHIAQVFGVTTLTVKNHWFLHEEFPNYIIENHNSKLVEIVEYLQKVIASNNQVANISS